MLLLSKLKLQLKQCAKVTTHELVLNLSRWSVFTHGPAAMQIYWKKRKCYKSEVK